MYGKFMYYAHKFDRYQESVDAVKGFKPQLLLTIALTEIIERKKPGSNSVEKASSTKETRKRLRHQAQYPPKGWNMGVCVGCLKWIRFTPVQIIQLDHTAKSAKSDREIFRLHRTSRLALSVNHNVFRIAHYLNGS
jgi:hypothetical protein